MTTQLGSHLLKSNDGHPPAPGTAVVGPAVVTGAPDGAAVVAEIGTVAPTVYLLFNYTNGKKETEYCKNDNNS